MTPEQLIDELQALAARISETVDLTRWYLFGSSLANPPDAADIDVLVICQTHVAGDAIRYLINQDELYRQLHVSIFTEAEEVEVSFVARHGCVRVF